MTTAERDQKFIKLVAHMEQARQKVLDDQGKLNDCRALLIKMEEELKRLEKQVSDSGLLQRHALDELRNHITEEYFPHRRVIYQGTEYTVHFPSGEQNPGELKMSDWRGVIIAPEDSE